MKKVAFKKKNVNLRQYTDLDPDIKKVFFPSVFHKMTCSPYSTGRTFNFGTWTCAILFSYTSYFQTKTQFFVLLMCQNGVALFYLRINLVRNKFRCSNQTENCTQVAAFPPSTARHPQLVFHFL